MVSEFWRGEEILSFDLLRVGSLECEFSPTLFSGTRVVIGLIFEACETDLSISTPVLAISVEIEGKGLVAFFADWLFCFFSCAHWTPGLGATEPEGVIEGIVLLLICTDNW